MPETIWVSSTQYATDQCQPEEGDEGGGGGGGGGVCGKRLKDAWVRQSRRGTNVGAVAHMGFYKSY